MREFVEASAGTRKTTRLVGAVLDALLVEDIRVENILAITFTEKAAAEMRERLAKVLRQVRTAGSQIEEAKVEPWDCTPSEFARRKGLDLGVLRQRAERASRSLDRAFVGTIHSFCMRLLRLFPREAGVPPVLEADTGERFDALFEAAWGGWVARELARPDDEWPQLFDRWSLEGLRGLAKALANFTTPAAFLDRPYEDSRMVQDARDLLRDEANWLAGILGTLAGNWGPIAARHLLPDFQRAMQQCAQGGRADPIVRARIRTWKKGHQNWPAAPRGWDAEDWERVLQIRQMAEDLDSVDEPVVRTAVSKLAGFVGEFRRAYLARGFITFAGMLDKAREVLGHRHVRDQVKQMFRRIFVDEFQDTDPVQYEIVLALAEKDDTFAGDWTKMQVDPEKLFVVGDPKQSIYSFRGADLEAYDEVRKKLLGSEMRLERPQENWRSCRNIIDFVNNVFRNIFPTTGSALQPEFVELIHTRSGLCTGRSDCVRCVHIEDTGGVEENTAAEARWIACEILRLRESEGRPYGHFAILLRKLTRAHLFMEALHQAGIPYVIDGDKAFLERPEVRDLYNVLRAVADPRDEIAIVGVLRGPVGGMTDRQILELRQAEPHFNYLAREDHDVFRLLRDLHELAGTVPPSELVRQIFLRTPLLAAARASERGEMALANLLKFYRMVSQTSVKIGASIKLFVQKLQEAILDHEERSEESLADDNADVVRIMSIHRAKGLDFGVVFVPILAQEARGQEERVRVNVRWLTGDVWVDATEVRDLASVVESRREAQVHNCEAARVLYVALTRAKERLVLVRSGQRARGGSFAEFLDKRCGGQIFWEQVKPPEPDALARAGRVEWEQPDWNALQLRWTKIDALAEAAGDERCLGAREAAMGAPLSEGPHGEAVERQMEVGQQVHQALEQLDFQKPLLPEDLEGEARQIVARFLDSEAFRHLRGVRILARELPILLPDGGRVVSGRIDVVYEEGEEVVVADYKTDRSESEAARYREVMAFYARAVGPLFAGRRVRRALIWVRSGKIQMLD